MKNMQTLLSVSALASAGLIGSQFFETKDDKANGDAPAPVDTKEVKDTLDNLAKGFTDFQKTNDERLAALEKGKSTADYDDKLEKQNSAMDKMQKTIDDLRLEAKRPQQNGKQANMSEDEIKHRDQFASYLRKGDLDGLAELQQKALSIGSDADGGFAVPEMIDSEILSLMQDLSPIRQIANVKQVSTSDYKKLVNKHGVGAAWEGEDDTNADSNTPSLAEIVPPMGRLAARPQITEEIMDDAFFDVEQWLAEEVSKEFAIKEGAAFINGNGTNKPRGFLATGTPVATADATRAFGSLQFVASGAAAAMPTNFDPLIDLVGSLKAGHRNNAYWVVNRQILAIMRKYKDADGQYLWQPQLASGRPQTFLGYPIMEAEDMPGVGAGNFPIAFGNFKAGYQIVDRMGTRTLRDPFSAKPNIEFYMRKRVGGAVIDSEAIKLLKIAAS